MTTPANHGDALSLAWKCDQVCDAFEAAWRTTREGEAPRIENFLGSVAGSQREALLRELIPLDAYYRFKRAWQSAACDRSRPRIEDYLGHATHLELAALLRQLIPLDIAFRCRRGEALCLQDYMGPFPSLLNESWLVDLLPNRNPTNPSRPAPDPEPTCLYQPALKAYPVPDQKAHVSHSSGHPRFVPGMLLASRYRIVAPLGKGGMGEVYRADDLVLGQPVALKFLPENLTHFPEHLQRFRKEVATARRVSHPSCCRVYDLAEHEGQPFLTMEYIDGEDLASLLRRVGRLPEEKAEQLARELCGALAAVHEQGLLHRDLKPANVMLDGRGKVRLADFGLATSVVDLSASGAGAGTPAYMAPEQLQGESASVSSDLFALGLVLYELFTGRKPFPADTREELLRRYESGPPSRPSSIVAGLGAALERIILRCLEKDIRARPRSAYEVQSALPGGDPLRAALAAGETPSPRLVAEAGGEGGLSPFIGGTLLTAVLVGLVAAVLLIPWTRLIAHVPLNLPPEVLAHKAEEFLEEQGIGKSRHRALGFDHDSGYLGWLEDDPSPTRWDVLGRSYPAALFFWYRQSPEPLVPGLYYPFPGALEVGRITWHDPPSLLPGMVAVKLDLKGRPIEYRAVPPEQARPGEADRKVKNWESFFTAAGLEGEFTPGATPSLTPPCFADQRKAWSGTLPGRSDIPIQVEAAAYQDQLVFFKIVGPWTRRDALDAPASVSTEVSAVGRAITFALLLGAAAVLAPWNLRQGRADRAGAFRLAFFVFVLFLLVWLFETPHVLGVAELRLLVQGLACALYWAGLCWLSYVALEPFARRMWPETLISWSRLLAGRVSDPRVGRDLLIGTLTGVGWFVLFSLARLGPALVSWSGQPPLVPYWDWWIPNTLLSGFWVGNFLADIAYAIRNGLFFWLLFLILFRAVVRKPWLAIGLYVLTLAIIKGPIEGLPASSWPFVALAQTLGVVVLVRCGVLAVITMSFIAYTLEFPITLDLSAWYARDGLLAIGFVVTLAAYGCWTARIRSMNRGGIHITVRPANSVVLGDESRR